MPEAQGPLRRDRINRTWKHDSLHGETATQQRVNVNSLPVVGTDDLWVQRREWKRLEREGRSCEINITETRRR